MKLRPLASAAVFAGVTSAAMLFGSLATPASSGTTFGVFTAQAAFADEDDERGQGNRQDQNCINPAGHERGRCDHGDGEHERHFKHHKHHKHGDNSQYATISGTVLSVNGNTAQIRLDDGRTITVDTAGTQVGIGQHLSLNGCYQNGIFVVNCNGSQYGGNGNGSGYGQQQVHGTILSVSGNIVTLLGLPPVRVDISRAQANNAIYGQLTIARSITAYGYSQNGTFYATSIR